MVGINVVGRMAATATSTAHAMSPYSIKSCPRWSFQKRTSHKRSSSPLIIFFRLYASILNQDAGTSNQEKTVAQLANTLITRDLLGDPVGTAKGVAGLGY